MYLAVWFRNQEKKRRGEKGILIRSGGFLISTSNTWWNRCCKIKDRWLRRMFRLFSRRSFTINGLFSILFFHPSTINFWAMKTDLPKKQRKWLCPGFLNYIPWLCLQRCWKKKGRKKDDLKILCFWGGRLELGKIFIIINFVVTNLWIMTNRN